MKSRILSLVVAICVAGLTMSAIARSEDMPMKHEATAAKPAKMAMVKYLVIAPHTAEACVKALDEMESAKTLSKFDFGCMDGDHTGYAIVTAASAEEALKIVPADERAMAKAIKLSKFTPADLKAIHEKMMKS